MKQIKLTLKQIANLKEISGKDRKGATMNQYLTEFLVCAGVIYGTVALLFIFL